MNLILSVLPALMRLADEKGQPSSFHNAKSESIDWNEKLSNAGRTVGLSITAALTLSGLTVLVCHHAFRLAEKYADRFVEGDVAMAIVYAATLSMIAAVGLMIFRPNARQASFVSGGGRESGPPYSLPSGPVPDVVTGLIGDFASGFREGLKARSSIGEVPSSGV